MTEIWRAFWLSAEVAVKPKVTIKKEKTDIEKTVDDVKHAGQLANKFVNDGIVMLEESKEPLPRGFVEVSPRGSLQAAAP